MHRCTKRKDVQTGNGVGWGGTACACSSSCVVKRYHRALPRLWLNLGHDAPFPGVFFANEWIAHSGVGVWARMLRATCSNNHNSLAILFSRLPAYLSTHRYQCKSSKPDRFGPGPTFQIRSISWLSYKWCICMSWRHLGIWGNNLDDNILLQGYPKVEPFRVDD